MRWKQRTYKESKSGYTFTVVLTKETVEPFRSFEQKKLFVKDLPLDASMWKNGKVITDPFWILPDNIDALIEEMEEARLNKDWTRSDELREHISANGIVIRNGIDWYPILLEKDYKGEKFFNSWLFSTWMSGISSVEPTDRPTMIKHYKEHMAILEKEVKDKYNF